MCGRFVNITNINIINQSASFELWTTTHAKMKKWKAFNDLSKSLDTPIKPEFTIASLRSVLDNDAVVVADPGTPCPYFSAYYNFKKSGRYFVTNRAHGALGYALPASIGVQIARPKNKVVSVMGDGSFGFAVGELETAKRLSLPIIFFISKNFIALALVKIIPLKSEKSIVS